MNTPWKANGSGETMAIWVEDSEGKRVCTVRNCATDLDRAYLIAAAPDLLDALIVAEKAMQQGISNIDIGAAFQQVRAAITKARGL